jgi:hypothetical protein
MHDNEEDYHIKEFIMKLFSAVLLLFNSINAPRAFVVWILKITIPAVL